jgi:hypothetical protein
VVMAQNGANNRRVTTYEAQAQRRRGMRG